MNQHQVISHSQPLKMTQSHQLMHQSQVLNRFQLLNLPQMLNPMLSQAEMMPSSYGNWTQQSLNMPPMTNLKFPNQMNPKFGGPNPGRSNWKGNNRSKAGGGTVGPGSGELETQNRLKARRFNNHKKKFNRMGPYAHAPRNTTSYLIRAKKEGGIVSLVSPWPVTPAVLPTPVFSPSREALVDMAKAEWGVNGYGSMKGLIRLRSSPSGHELEMDGYEDEDEGDSSESDVEEHLEVERRLDHDLSRFEMIYPNIGSEYTSGLENRVDDQDTHLSQLEGENVLLKEKLHLMERELGEIKRRMQSLETQNQVVEEILDEVVDNVSENSSEGTLDVIAGEVLDDGSIKRDTEFPDENNDLMSGCGEVDDGKDLIKKDKIGSIEAAGDASMEDNAPNKELEFA